MKNIVYIFLCLVIILASSCEKDGLPLPNDVSDLKTTPRVGSVVVRWVYPKELNMKYIQVRYEKNGTVINSNASTFSDSCVVKGLLNKLSYTFEVQTFNADGKGGKILMTQSVKPLRRSIDTTFTYPAIPLTASMLTTYTQESSEGPKDNLVDGKPSTYWHTAWSAGVQPLPHYIQIAFPSATTLGGFKYYMRNPSSTSGRPSQWDMQTSDDGTTFTTRWTSASGLAVDPVANEFVQYFDKGYKAKFFRIRIIANPGNVTYTHLGEFSVFDRVPVVIDNELEAEKNY